MTFNNAPALKHDSDEFIVRLANGTAVFELKGHISSVEAAKEMVDVFVRAWELDAALKFGHREICFVYEQRKLLIETRLHRENHR